MSIDALLDDAINDGKIILQIDEPSRTIFYPGGSLLLGVEGDIDSHRLYFEIPSESIGDGILLGEATVNIYIDFINAEYTTCICEASDKSVKDGATTFSWLLDKRVAIRDGKVEFRVRITDTDAEGNLREWHTANFEATILNGIDVDDKTPEVVTEESSIFALKQQVEDASKQLEAAEDELNKTTAVIEKYLAKQHTVFENYNPDVWENLELLTSYTEVGSSLEPGNYKIYVNIPDLEYSDTMNYSGTHIFRGYVRDCDREHEDNVTILYADDIVTYDTSSSYAMDEPSFIQSLVYRKLALIIKTTYSEGLGNYFSSIILVAITNQGNPDAIGHSYYSGTVLQVLKETIVGGNEEIEAWDGSYSEEEGGDQ